VNAKNFAVGMPLSAASAALEAMTTRPPEHYTENTLMDDMLAAYKFASNDADRELLKSISGIGTSRTRGVIIKGFVDRRFLIRTKKAKLFQLKISAEGRALLSGLPDEIKDVTLTAKWERALELVATGKVKPEQLIAKVNMMLRELVAKLLPASPLKN
jgi:DNA topoisomerase-3